MGPLSLYHMYTHIESSVNNNGHTSEFLSLVSLSICFRGRGVSRLCQKKWKIPVLNFTNGQNVSNISLYADDTTMITCQDIAVIENVFSN